MAPRPGRRAASIGVALVIALTMVAAVPAATAVSAGGVAITVRCYSNPEKVTIKNNRGSAIRVTKVGSTYQPYSYEPFSVSKRIAPGKSVTFKAGNAASGANVLTGNYIFNDNGRDGVRVVTSVGTFKKDC